MGKIKDEEIINKIKEIHSDNKVLNIYRLEKNKKIRICVDYICGECGFTWKEISWEAIKRRKTKYCNKCKIKQRKYDVNYIEKELLGLGFKWLNKEDYVDASSSLITRCLKCGKVSKANVCNRIKDKRKCVVCIGNNTKTIEGFKKEVYELEGENYIVLSDLYTEAHESNILIRHNECGNEYYVSRSNFRKGRRCPKCSVSKGEDIIIRYLKSYNIEYVYEKKFDNLLGVGNGSLSYDFYLPKYNLLIEYQGEQHEHQIVGFGDFERQQEHDKRKREYAKRHNIELLEIWYWNFDNIEEILEEMLFR